MLSKTDTNGSEVITNDPQKTQVAMDAITSALNSSEINLVDGITALVMTLVLALRDHLIPGATIEAAIKELVDQAIPQAERWHAIKKDDLKFFDSRFSKTVN